MTATFDYKAEKVFTESLEVEDVGNCALKCATPDYVYFYISTQTVMGKTYLLKFGPVIPDLEELDGEFALEYKCFDYKEGTIIKEITKFINDAKRNIVEIETIDIKEALQMIPTYDKFIPVE